MYIHVYILYIHYNIYIIYIYNTYIHHIRFAFICFPCLRWLTMDIFSAELVHHVLLSTSLLPLNATWNLEKLSQNWLQGKSAGYPLFLGKKIWVFLQLFL